MKRKVIASMDVVKLFNNLEIDESAKIVGEMVTESKIKFEGIDTNELAFYLWKYLTNDVIEANEFQDIVYKKVMKEKEPQKKKRVVLNVNETKQR